MAVLVGVAQAVALHRHADRADQQRREHQRRPEADPSRQLVAEEGAQHVEAGMREVEHAHHAEDDGQAARQQEEQHAEQDAVEGRNDNQFKHSALDGYPGLMPRSNDRPMKTIRLPSPAAVRMTRARPDRDDRAS